MTFKERFDREKNWKQKALIVNLYHKMMIAKDIAHSHRDVAKYFRISTGTVSEYIQILDNIERVDHCNTRIECMKILRAANKS